MKYALIVGIVLAVALGVTVVVLGGADDSPGLQLIGVGLVVCAVVFGVRSLRRRG
ncbi:hypothetical protein O7634_17750 [Micromonospora sp. WMMD1120]|uniref:hypothetical protein n=1 Tax=Micromonospora sp. WMMD1120 TaxID=3016106 RepID=UPI002417B43B|nr:hypothetical protein [Micromonospora sp. WMMD1120]MDG4808599.1 hypothetical protein [Micromonospora sp. WMMD1120]